MATIFVWHIKRKLTNIINRLCRKLPCWRYALFCRDVSWSNRGNQLALTLLVSLHHFVPQEAIVQKWWVLYISQVSLSVSLRRVYSQFCVQSCLLGGGWAQLSGAPFPVATPPVILQGCGPADSCQLISQFSCTVNWANCHLTINWNRIWTFTCKVVLIS